MRIKKRVFVILPRAGLGNQLFPLAKGYLYSQQRGLNLIIIAIFRYRIGPLLRFEKSNKNYIKYFTIKEYFIVDIVNYLFLKYKAIFDPVKYNPPLDFNCNSDVCFDEISHWSDYFSEINLSRIQFRDWLLSVVDVKILNDYNSRGNPDIGIHIRMGDFRELLELEDFKKVGSVRTPLFYFIDVINKLRSGLIKYNKITVFTDGSPGDLNALANIEGVEFASGNTDIGDLLHLSKSKVIVTSAGSTFSYWAGFLSDSPIIMHPDHIHEKLRLEPDLFEGTVDEFLISRFYN